MFHVSLLRPAARKQDYLPGQLIPPPEPVVVDGKEEYFVESIEGLRYNRRSKRHEYHVKWTGYNEMTWEPAADLKDNAAVVGFYKRFPDISEPPKLMQDN